MLSMGEWANIEMYKQAAAYALTANTNYIITGKAGEVRDLG
jgi:hypothetical protein